MEHCLIKITPIVQPYLVKFPDFDETMSVITRKKSFRSIYTRWKILPTPSPLILVSWTTFSTRYIAHAHYSTAQSTWLPKWWPWSKVGVLQWHTFLKIIFGWNLVPTLFKCILGVWWSYISTKCKKKSDMKYKCIKGTVSWELRWVLVNINQKLFLSDGFFGCCKLWSIPHIKIQFYDEAQSCRFYLSFKNM